MKKIILISILLTSCTTTHISMPKEGSWYIVEGEICIQKEGVRDKVINCNTEKCTLEVSVYKNQWVDVSGCAGFLSSKGVIFCDRSPTSELHIQGSVEFRENILHYDVAKTFYENAYKIHSRVSAKKIEFYNQLEE